MRSENAKNRFLHNLALERIFFIFFDENITEDVIKKMNKNFLDTLYFDLTFLDPSNASRSRLSIQPTAEMGRPFG